MITDSEASFTASGATVTGNYEATDTWRLDNATVRDMPEPSAALLGAFGLFASLRVAVNEKIASLMFSGVAG